MIAWLHTLCLITMHSFSGDLQKINAMVSGSKLKTNPLTIFNYYIICSGYTSIVTQLTNSEPFYTLSSFNSIFLYVIVKMYLKSTDFSVNISRSPTASVSSDTSSLITAVGLVNNAGKAPDTPDSSHSQRSDRRADISSK